MKRVFSKDEYTIEIWVEEGPAGRSSMAAEVVVKRTRDAEIMAAFTQYAVGFDLPPTVDETVALGRDAALDRIETGFSSDS